MAKSGQCSSHQPHPLHRLASATTGAPFSSCPMQLRGQKAAQIPHALHQPLKISISKAFFAF